MTLEQNHMSYRVRLRFRLQKKLNIDSPEQRFQVGRHEAVLTAMPPETAIKDNEWLVINVRGFLSEVDARTFGQELRTALELASVSARLGVDVGRDLATSSFGEHVKEQILRETGTILRSNVHGLDVFEDDPRITIFAISGTATVRASPDPFLPLIADLHGQTHVLSPQARDVLLLLNYALMRPEPVAQIVFAFSAVEMLGQDRSWSPDQRGLIDDLAHAAINSSLACLDERQEVADAISRSLQRLSLRQGVMRMLSALGLGHLRRTWDALYAERSTLVHGLAPRPGSDYSDLANRAVTLCGHILLKVVAKELPAADRHAATYFPVPE